MEITARVHKPPHYKSHFIVNDPNPKLVVSLTNTMFQGSMDLSQDECDEFEVTEEGDFLVISRKDDE